MIVVDKKGRLHWNIFWTQMRLVSSERAQAAINAQKRGSLAWQWVKFDTFLDWAQMMHKHSQEMSEAFFAGCCQARQFKGHAPTSTHGELQKNPNKLAELDRLGAARSWSDGTWWAPKGPKRPWNDGWLERALLVIQLETALDLVSSKRAQVFSFRRTLEWPKLNNMGSGLSD